MPDAAESLSDVKESCSVVLFFSLMMMQLCLFYGLFGGLWSDDYESQIVCLK